MWSIGGSSIRKAPRMGPTASVKVVIGAHPMQTMTTELSTTSQQLALHGRQRVQHAQEASYVAVDLSDLIESLQRELSPPGNDFYPDATDDQLLGNLSDAFWEAYLDGFMGTFTEADGLVSPVTTGDPDLTRDYQQLIVFYAGFRVLRAAARSTNTRFRAKAGPVEFETEQSATLLRELFLEMKLKRDLLLQRLSDIGDIPTTYIDAVRWRTDSIMFGNTYFVR